MGDAMEATPELTRRIVAALSRPDAYPDRPQHVRVVETHMSWVFVTDERAYKLKKPLRYSYLDFSTPEARRINSEREIRLNRRFSMDVYHGLWAVLPTADGLCVGGPGPDAVDWLVAMRRLDDTRTLERGLLEGWAEAATLRPALWPLLAHYRAARSEPMGGFDYVNRLWRQLEADAAELVRAEFGLDAERVARIRRGCLGYLAAQAAVPASRARRGWLVEGHGDLRPEHVYLVDQPRLVDCLEFNRAFRVLDPIDELASLSLHCARLGGDWVRPLLFDMYEEVTGDRPPAPLIAFYLAARGLLWAKLAVWHLGHAGADRARWRRRAESYLEIAEAQEPRMGGSAVG